MISLTVRIGAVLCTAIVGVLPWTSPAAPAVERGSGVGRVRASDAPGRAQAAGAPDSATMRSVSDGVYTEAQAKRGRRAYLQECASCHAEDLRGGETALPLIGRSFRAAWADGTLGDLFETIRTTMPEETPGGLSDQVYVRVLAYLLESNRFPPGAEPLAADLEGLDEIGLEAEPPQ